jgi:hypothetical protein
MERRTRKPMTETVILERNIVGLMVTSNQKAWKSKSKRAPKGDVTDVGSRRPIHAESFCNEASQSGASLLVCFGNLSTNSLTSYGKGVSTGQRLVVDRNTTDHSERQPHLLRGLKTALCAGNVNKENLPCAYSGHSMYATPFTTISVPRRRQERQR